MDWLDFKERVFQKLSWVFDFSKFVIGLTIIVLIIHFFIATIFVVSGQSMEPNFHNGEYLLVNRLAVRNLKRGDVVGLYYPGNPKEKYIKRIIGLPGEKIQIKKSKIIIYNQNRPEGFILYEGLYIPKETITEPNKTWQIDKDEYFVIGDNRENSSDSRLWGPLPKKYLVGRAILILWPFRRINTISRVDY